jgi:exopolysaccharide biosynthesis polyprenyl glycosylphosphotransferase
MLRRFSINFALFSMILDGLFVLMGLWLASVVRPFMNSISGIEPIPSPVLNPPLLYFLFPFVWILIYSALSIYDGRKFLRAVDEFAILAFAVAIASVSSAGILYFSYREVSRALFVVFVLISYAFCFSWRFLARIYFRSQKITPDRNHRVLVVGAGSLGVKVQQQMSEADLANLTLVGFIDDDQNLLQGSPLKLGGSGVIRDAIKANDITDVVIALPHSQYHQMGDMVQKLDDMPVQVWVALGFFDLALYNTTIEDFAGIPMLDLRASAIDDYQRMIKRAFDFVFGLAALIVALPLIALSALLVYFEDGRPILFRQKRVGENGRLFEMLKFRTMVRNAEQLQGQVERRDAEGNLIHKSKDDPRVTRVGRFLRRFSLDELPQFFNILRGDMSIVGPRPEMPFLVEKYQPWQRKRFAVPPGLTGWWQVSGRSDKPMHLHTEDDLYYIQNYSILLDLQIILKTIWVVLIGKGSY